MYSRALFALLALAVVRAAPALAEPTPVAGHYYLQGVRETGSELLLTPDGRFQWYLAYGALDQKAEGTWTRSADTVTLKVREQDRTKPMFRPDVQLAWDASHELFVLERDRDERIAELERTCLPPRCALPPEARVDEDHPDLWKGGIIIAIADPAMGVAPQGVSVTLTWADGHREIAKTARRGWALFPRRAGIKAGHVLIDPPFAPWVRAEFDFPALEKGLQSFVMNARQITTPPFETLTLRIDGKDLIPEGLGGRYVRGGRE